MTHGPDQTPALPARWWWPALLPLGAFLALAWSLWQHALPWRLELAWVPTLGLDFELYVDALSAQFLVLVTGIGVLVFVYAGAYMAHAPGTGRLFALLTVFVLAMIGTVSADHLLVLLVFWELTSLCSFLLVGFDRASPAARAASRMALFVTLGGGLALLAAFILLADIAGSWSLQALLAAREQLLADPRLPAALGLLFVGCFSKSAQFPFHFWLPGAMTAPTPVSAFLHSATLVKLGIYLLARLDQAFDTLLVWQAVLLGIGALTATWSALLALRETDLKRILARSTVSALGTLTLLIGLSGPQAALAVIAFLFAHALYKAPLFFVAGNVDHATGTRDVARLSGLRRDMPWTTVAALLAGLSMAGLPLSFGYVAKDVIGTAKSSGGELLGASATVVLLFVNAGAVAVAAVATLRIFFGRPCRGVGQVREAPWPMLVPPLLLGVLGLEFELVPNLADPLLVDAARAMTLRAEVGEMVVARDLVGSLGAAAPTLLVGLLLFASWPRIQRRLGAWRWLERVGPEAAFAASLRVLPRVAAWHMRTLQHGALDDHLRRTLSALLGLGLAAGLMVGLGVPQLGRGVPGQLVAAVLIAAGALAAPGLRDRLALLLVVGVVGYGSAALFLFAGAPDVAWTQLMIETALVVIATALLPAYGPTLMRRHGEPRLRNAAIALAAAAASFVLLLQLFARPADPMLALWFAERAVPQAYGHNVVNVILVDFRAFDTLGEVSVVFFASLAVVPLLAGRGAAAAVARAPVVADSPMLARGARRIWWLMLLAAAWLLWRGHNAPGGGFIGGLVAVTATALIATLHGRAAARRRLPLAPLPLAASGVLLALASGVPGALAGRGWLTHLWWSLDAGGFELKLSTVLLFDLGVLLTVWGAFATWLMALLDRDGEEGSA